MRLLIGEPVPLAPVENPDEINIDDEDEAEDNSAEPVKVEENDLFFIDSNPQKRTKLNLPPPTAEASVDEEPTDSTPAKTEQYSEKVEVETNQDVSAVKKFKRRNQSLYTSEDL